MKINSKPQDYRRYRWKRTQWLMAIGRALGVVMLLSHFFYRSPAACFPLLGIGYLYYRNLERRRGEKQLRDLEEQFRECILSVAASLRAGYAVENAFLESIPDMKLMYGEESMICRELELFRRGLVINITMEELQTDFSVRSGSEEIGQFAEVFSIAKRSGGNLAAVIQNTAELIGRHIEARQELRTVLGGREMEHNIMKAMPFAILLYIGTSSRGYFDGLYHNLQGIIIMTVCLILYLTAWRMGENILWKLLN